MSGNDLAAEQPIYIREVVFFYGLPLTLHSVPNPLLVKLLVKLDESRGLTAYSEIILWDTDRTR